MGSDNFNYASSCNLSEDLTMLAKETLLLDIRKRFNSKFLLPDAVKELIDSYVKEHECHFDNRNELLVSLLREVLEANFVNKHYGEYSGPVIEAIIDDLS